MLGGQSKPSKLWIVLNHSAKISRDVPCLVILSHISTPYNKLNRLHITLDNVGFFGLSAQIQKTSISLHQHGNLHG